MVKVDIVNLEVGVRVRLVCFEELLDGDGPVRVVLLRLLQVRRGRENAGEFSDRSSGSLHTLLRCAVLLTVPGLPFWLPGMKPPPWSAVQAGCGYERQRKQRAWQLQDTHSL